MWDERNGLLWAEPFDKVLTQWCQGCCWKPLNLQYCAVNLQAYHAHETVVMYQPSLKTFRFRVLTESLIVKRLADYANSDSAKHVCGI